MLELGTGFLGEGERGRRGCVGRAGNEMGMWGLVAVWIGGRKMLIFS